jgi:hypothetical protein
MNFYTQQHKHYCGIDLHAKAMYVCILDQAGTWLHQDRRSAFRTEAAAKGPPTLPPHFVILDLPCAGQRRGHNVK